MEQESEENKEETQTCPCLKQAKLSLYLFISHLHFFLVQGCVSGPVFEGGCITSLPASSLCLPLPLLCSTLLHWAAMLHVLPHTHTHSCPPSSVCVCSRQTHTHTDNIIPVFFFTSRASHSLIMFSAFMNPPFPPPFLLIVLISLMHFGLRLPVGSLTAVVHFHSATSLIVICIQLLSRHIPLAVSLTTHTIAVSLRTVVLC